jgi:phosphatidylinositol glycan class M
MNICNTLLKFVLLDCRYIIALGLRIFIILITEWLYLKLNVVYTDIDYHVFSDGAKHLLKLESPYNRETYRYTPILAMMMVPNHIINYNFGKILFSFVDVLVGLLIEILLNIQKKEGHSYKKEKGEVSEDDSGILKMIYSYIDNPYAMTSLLYLYNPFTINICTRGSADCLITFLVLLTLIFLEIGFFPIAGLVFGVAIHFKIYPIIYAPALYLYLISQDKSIKRILNDGQQEASEIKSLNKSLNSESLENESIISKAFYSVNSISRKFWKKIAQTTKILLFSICNFRAITFAFLTVFTFILFLFCFYIFFGNKFIYEYLLYHLLRKDHRHNYSIFYYLIYLTYNSSLSKILSLITFLPQAILIMLSTIFLFHKINLCLLVLTMIFVTFNKVVTAQYFLWYICLIPLVAPKNKLFDFKKHPVRFFYGVFLFSVWLFLELIWNSFSHRLEYKGENLFLEIWGINLAFFITNCLIIKEIIVNHI